MTEWLTPAAITALLAGLATTIGLLVKARVDLRRTRLDEDRQPVELESIFIGGAERAVSALQVALDRAESSINRLEQALTDRDHQLQQRDLRISELEQQVTRTLARVALLQEQCEQLKDRLAAMRTDPREGEAI